MKGREFKRVWGQPWDSEFLLLIEQRKLREMSKYFQKSRLVEGWERTVKEINLCVKLLDIILEKDVWNKAWYKAQRGMSRMSEDMPAFPKYINTRNYKRFVDYEGSKRNWINEFWKTDIRRTKALHLYNKIRSYRMLRWYD